MKTIIQAVVIAALFIVLAPICLPVVVLGWAFEGWE